MRINRINQNNYQNNRQKDIGFKLNSCVILDGLHCNYSRFSDDTARALQKAIFDPLWDAGRIKKGSIYKVIPDENDPSKYWVLDKETMDRINDTKTEDEGDNLWDEIVRGIRTFRVNWANKRAMTTAS